MFNALLQLVARASAPQVQYQGFLGELRARWRQNVAAATLLARHRWREIPEGLAQRANLLERQYQRRVQSWRDMRDVDHAVNVQAQTWGMAPSYAASSAVASPPGLNHDEVMFLRTMAIVRAHRGESTATPAQVKLAEAVLSGRMDPLDLLERVTAPVAGGMMRQLSLVVGDFRGLWRVTGLVLAAQLLPMDRIPAYLEGASAPAPAPEVRRAIAAPGGGEAALVDRVEQRVSRVRALIDAEDVDGAAETLYEALADARRTKSGDDDLETVQLAVLLSMRAPLEAKLTVRCLRTLQELFETDRRVDDAATVLVSLARVIGGQPRSGAIDLGLRRAIDAGLSKAIQERTAVQLELCAADIMSRASDEAAALARVDAARARASTPDDMLDVAMGYSELALREDDRERAASALVSGLDQADGAEPAKVVTALQQLLWLWPPHEAGFEPWLERLRRALQEEDPSCRAACWLALSTRAKGWNVHPTILAAAQDELAALPDLPDSVRAACERARA